MPCSEAFFTASSAAIWAANGVDLRDPLKPMVPADDQEIVLPCASVMVIIVLLNVEFTWATPDTMFFRSRRRTRVASFAIGTILQSRFSQARPDPEFVRTMRRSLLLAGDWLRLALAGAGVGMGALTAHRQLLAMAQAPIGAQIHQPLDVDRNFAAKITFDHIVAVDCFADLHDFGIGELGAPPLGWDVHLLDNLFGLLRPDAVDVLKRDDHALVSGNINACNASHSPISISATPRPKLRAAGIVWTSGGGRPLSRIPRERKKSHALGDGAGTQKRLRDDGHVERYWGLSREKWSSVSAGHTNVIAVARMASAAKIFRGGFSHRWSARYPSQYRPIPSIAAPKYT